MKQTIFAFSLIIVCLLILFQLARFIRLQQSIQPEVYIPLFGALFLAAGYFISRKIFVPKPTTVEKEIIIEKEVIIEKEMNYVPDPEKIEKSGISKREYEILRLIADGLSNQQIANQLFVSENTIKKHISSLFLKLDAERRTDAIKKAKQLQLI
jgi:DNA-binding CsgD family transcriptional regulator